MPGRPIAAFLLLFAAGLAVADGAPTQYSLRYDATTETMAVRLCVPRAAERMHFSADRGASRFVDALTRENAPVPVRDDHGWTATDWRAGECLAYRVALGRIADDGRRGGGAHRGGALTSDPGLWLLRPDGDAD